MVSADLKSKYNGIVNIVNMLDSTHGCEKESASKLYGLLCLFSRVGTVNESDFEEILAEDWTWECYTAILRELRKIGAVDSNNQALPDVCFNVAGEILDLFANNSSIGRSF